MLSSSERRFLRSWEEQRKGGKGKYLLLYILAGTFIATIIIAFVMSIISYNFTDNIPLVAIGAAVSMTLVSIITWFRNEAKFKAIIKREVIQGADGDGLGAAEGD